MKEYRHAKVTYNEERDAYELWIYVGSKRYPNAEDYSLSISA